VDRLLENKMIKNFSDIYYLTKEQICSLERMGEKSAKNLIDSILDSKNQPFHKVLYSLGIRYVGETVSKKISKELRTIDELMTMSFDEIILIDEIGEKIAYSLINYFNDEDNIKLINDLKLVGLNFESNDQAISSNLNNNKFVISGTFKEIDRNSLKNLIEINGGKLLSSISSKTDFLIKGENVGPSKLKKAQQFGVKIISFSEFINYFKIDLHD
jgi:DNA ligase (NAD+)